MQANQQDFQAQQLAKQQEWKGSEYEALRQMNLDKFKLDQQNDMARAEMADTRMREAQFNNLILPRLRGFALKNHGYYRKDPRGPAAMERFCELFFAAIADTRKNEAQLAQAMEGLLAYLEKVVAGLESGDLPAYRASLAGCFQRLGELDDNIQLFIVQGHHPIKKIAAAMLSLVERPLGGARAGRRCPAARAPSDVA